MTLWYRVSSIRPNTCSKYLLSVAAELVGVKLPSDKFITTEARGAFARLCFEIVEKKSADEFAGAEEIKIQDERMLTLEWLDQDSKGYTDFYPISWFLEPGIYQGKIHVVRGPRGGSHQAKCDLRVNADNAEMNYEPYTTFNDRNDMEAGTQRLFFTDKTRAYLADYADWRVLGGKFAHVSVKVGVVASARQQLSAEDDLQPDEAESVINPPRRSGVKTFYIRNAKVRRDVLERAGGVCEYCRKKGFLTHLGNLFLETHHILALSENGPDTIDNVIALCPNDHRAAHYGVDELRLNEEMLSVVKEKQAHRKRLGKG
jgi:hypothetical protein